MNEYICKAKLLNSDRWVTGAYLQHPETTYCFSEDYERAPVKIHHIIAKSEMTDWGLPNQLRCYEVEEGTVCRCTGEKDKNGRLIFEHDILKTGCGKAIVRYGAHQHAPGSSVMTELGFYVEFPDEADNLKVLRQDFGWWRNQDSEIVGSEILEDELERKEGDDSELTFTRVANLQVTNIISVIMQKKGSFGAYAVTVLAYLCSMLLPEGVVTCSIADLCNSLNLSKPTVIKAIDILIEFNLIKRIGRKDGVSIYAINSAYAKIGHARPVFTDNSILHTDDAHSHAIHKSIGFGREKG